MPTESEYVRAFEIARSEGDAKTARAIAFKIKELQATPSEEGPGGYMPFLNKSLAGVAGGSVDLVNAGLGLVGMGSEDPFGGTKSIRRGLSNVGIDTPDRGPRTASEHMGSSSGEVLGFGLPLGMLAKALGTGKGIVGGLAKTGNQRLVDKPARALAEGTLGAVGLGGAREIAQNNDLGPGATMAAEMGGELLAAASPSAAARVFGKTALRTGRVVGNAAKQIFDPREGNLLQTAPNRVAVPDSEGGNLQPATWGHLFAKGYNPSDAKGTQITTTKATYSKISAEIDKGEKVLDFSSGLGHGTKSLADDGYKIDGYEPFSQPDKRVIDPTYTDPSKIKSDSYDVVINNAVLNVVPEVTRIEILKDIYRVLKPGGRSYVNLMGWGNIKSRLNNPKTKLVGPREVITGKGTFQKGYTQSEFVEFVKQVLPDAKISRSKFGDVKIMITKPPKGPSAMDMFGRPH
tara:strand:+ start:179 stop:1561 length:1383 start_codon:yes stop_codon:yes gene_type:complete